MMSSGDQGCSVSPVPLLVVARSTDSCQRPISALDDDDGGDSATVSIHDDSLIADDLRVVSPLSLSSSPARRRLRPDSWAGIDKASSSSSSGTSSSKRPRFDNSEDDSGLIIGSGGGSIKDTAVSNILLEGLTSLLNIQTTSSPSPSSTSLSSPNNTNKNTSSSSAPLALLLALTELARNQAAANQSALTALLKQQLLQEQPNSSSSPLINFQNQLLLGASALRTSSTASPASSPSPVNVNDKPQTTAKTDDEKSTKITTLAKKQTHRQNELAKLQKTVPAPPHKMVSPPIKNSKNIDDSNLSDDDDLVDTKNRSVANISNPLFGKVYAKDGDSHHQQQQNRFGSSWSPRKSGLVGSSSSNSALDRRVTAIAERFRTGPIRLWMVAGDTLQLWQFLLQLLLDTPLYMRNSDALSGDEAVKPNSAPSPLPPIHWTNSSGWEFKINDAETVAKLWGMYKNCPRMNYAKLARGLRFYYGKGIVEKTPISFVYRFFHDKVVGQPIDGMRLRQCYSYTMTNRTTPITVAASKPDNDARNCRLLSVARDVDKRTTIGELLRTSSQALKSPATVDGPIDLTTSDQRPNKVLNMLMDNLLTPEEEPIVVSSAAI